MPHIKLECTANVEIDSQLFFQELCQQLVATGHAPKLGMKCRLVVSDSYYIIDGNPDYKMVNLLFCLREGRSAETLALFSKIGMSLLEKYVAEDVAAKRISLSTEIKELIKERDLTKNTIR